LIANLALERRRGNEALALDIIRSLPYTRQPLRVPSDEWTAFLDMSLRRSGLLTIRAGDHVFLHQTLLDHLAARQVARTSPAPIRSLAAMFVATRSRWWWRWWPRREGMPWDDSYAGFLMDAFGDGSPEAAAVLHLLIRRAGRSACMFLARQARLGTRLRPDVIEAAVAVLQDARFVLVIGGGEMLTPPEAIAWLRGGGERELLLARANTRLHPGFRIPAAKELIRLGDSRGVDVLVDIAGDTTYLPVDRTPAAKELVRLGDSRGADLLTTILQTQRAWVLARVAEQAAPPVKLWRWVTRTLRLSPPPARGPEAVPATDHAETLMMLSDIAAERETSGEPAAAVIELEELLPHLTRVLGPDHPSTLAARSNLAYFRGQAGDVSGALAGFAALLKDQLRLFGEDDPSVEGTRDHIAVLHAQADGSPTLWPDREP